MGRAGPPVHFPGRDGDGAKGVERTRQNRRTYPLSIVRLVWNMELSPVGGEHACPGLRDPAGVPGCDYAGWSH